MTNPVSDEDVKRLVELLQGARDQETVQENLDELVHETKAGEAAEVNNGGYDAQARYLIETLGAKEAEAEIRSRLAS